MQWLMAFFEFDRLTCFLSIVRLFSNFYPLAWHLLAKCTSGSSFSSALLYTIVLRGVRLSVFAGLQSIMFPYDNVIRSRLYHSLVIEDFLVERISVSTPIRSAVILSHVANM